MSRLMTRFSNVSGAYLEDGSDYIPCPVVFEDSTEREEEIAARDAAPVSRSGIPVLVDKVRTFYYTIAKSAGEKFCIAQTHRSPLKIDHVLQEWYCNRREPLRLKVGTYDGKESDKLSLWCKALGLAMSAALLTQEHLEVA